MPGLVALPAVLLLAVVTGCASEPRPAGATSSAPSAQPADCLEAAPIEGVPERVVTLNGGAAAILDRLGVADTILGTSTPAFFAEFPADERQRLEGIPVLSERTANRESVIAAEPDLVMGISVYEFGGFDGTASPEQLAAAGISALAPCEPVDGSVTADIEQLFAFVERTAAVFEVDDRGAEVIEEMRTDLAEVSGEYDGEEPVRVLTLSAAPDGGQTINTSGGKSFLNGLIGLAGGANIAADIETDFASLSPEQVVERDPEAIVVVTGFSPVPDRQLVDAIRASPVLANTTAVRENRLVVVDQTISLSPSLLNAEAVRIVAEGVHRR